MSVPPVLTQPQNPPDRRAVRFRIGDFTTFRRALLDRLVADDLLPHLSNPFARRTRDAGDDYATIFLELWAYLADVLTFYQERIANEAYIQTATQREDVMRLARLVEYRPSPGAAATALLAFIADAGTPAIPAGFRVATESAGGEAPLVFETATALVARANTSAMPVVPAVGVEQFGPIAGVGDVRRRVVVGASDLALAPGDAVITVELPGPFESVTLHRLIDVQTDADSGTTAIVWNERAGTAYSDPPGDPVQLFVLRVVATPFGSTAPDWYALSPTLTDGPTMSPAQAPGPYYGQNWDDPGDDTLGNPWPFLPLPLVSPTTLVFDGVYDIEPGTRAVLLAAGEHGGTHAQACVIRDARETGVSAYALSGTATVAELDRAIAPGFRVRGTTIFAGAQRLVRHDVAVLPVPRDARRADLIELDGRYAELDPGQLVIVQGVVIGGELDGTTAAEEGTVASATVTSDATTELVLRAPLRRRYRRAECVVYGNVVAATHGDSVHDEVLGSGDATAFQHFALEESPLTNLAATDAEGLDATVSTLAVRVNGVAWSEVDSLYGKPATAHAYTTVQDAAGRTTVAFGDGVSGARPPTGVDNVRARYRYGLGTAGNVGAGAIAQLVDAVPGLQSVTNPLPAYGGADPETTAEIRAGAPLQAATFGRAVTVADVAALALRYPGVAKARATRASSPPAVLLAIAGPNPHPAAATGFTQLAARVRAFIEHRRDARLPLRVGSFAPCYVDFSVTIDVDAHHAHTATLDAVSSAFAPGRGGFFAFEHRTFGEAISLGALYAVAYAVDGVANARITRFAAAGAPAGTVREVLVAGGDELFVVIDEPSEPRYGIVTVTYGHGGYVDT